MTFEIDSHRTSQAGVAVDCTRASPQPSWDPVWPAPPIWLPAFHNRSFVEVKNQIKIHKTHEFVNGTYYAQAQQSDTELVMWTEWRTQTRTDSELGSWNCCVFAGTMYREQQNESNSLVIQHCVYVYSTNPSEADFLSLSFFLIWDSFGPALTAKHCYITFETVEGSEVKWSNTRLTLLSFNFAMNAIGARAFLLRNRQMYEHCLQKLVSIICSIMPSIYSYLSMMQLPSGVHLDWEENKKIQTQVGRDNSKMRNGVSKLEEENKQKRFKIWNLKLKFTDLIFILALRDISRYITSNQN